MSDSSRGAAVAGTFSRRSLLVATLAGTAVAAVGCTGEAGDAADAVTEAQADQLAAQVDVHTALVAAFDRAFAAGPLAGQAREQLARLRAAAPRSGGSSPATASSAPSSAAAPPLDPAGAGEYLRTEVARAADAHAAACPGFSGARAALLGSIAAGLRGQDGQLA
jgi:hypothetical protein